MRALPFLIAFSLATPAFAAPPMVVIDEKTTVVQEPPPHGNHGMSTAWRISDKAPGRNLEFRKRALHKGASIGLHILTHDEVYSVISGEGIVESDGVKSALKPGMTAYLYEGANVGITQVGNDPLTIIVAYPLAQRTK